MIPREFKLLLIFLAGFCLARQAHAQNFQMTDLGTLPGCTSSTAIAVNDNGHVIGQSCNHAFFWDNGVMTDLGTLPGHTSNTATAINISAQVIGSSRNHGFLWHNGLISDLRTLATAEPN